MFTPNICRKFIKKFILSTVTTLQLPVVCERKFKHEKRNNGRR